MRIDGLAAAAAAAAAALPTIPRSESCAPIHWDSLLTTARSR